MVFQKNIFKKLFPPLIIVFFAFVSGFSLLHKGLPPTHDGEYHVIRFYEFDKVLRDGNFYPRWAPDLNFGFGVPLFNYVYPLPNYFSSFVHFFGLSFIDSFKASLFIATILGALFFYLWTKEFWGEFGALVSSIFYTFSPYHFVDIYIRGSIGEVWALSLFPAYLWSITKFINNRNNKLFLASSIFLSLIIFSHNILSLMFLPFVITYVAFLILGSENKKYLSLKCIFSFLIAFGLTSIFWLPALSEIKFVRGLEVFGFSHHFPQVYELLIPSWGSGFSGDIKNHLSFQIGIANLFAVLLSILFIIKRKKGKNRGIILFFLVWFAFIFFLMIKSSTFLWEKVPLMGYFQFPWRFLSLEVVISSFLAGSFTFFIRSEKLKKFFAIFLVVLTFLLGFPYAKPAYYHKRSDSYYITKSNFIDSTNSPGNAFNTIWAKRIEKREENKINIQDSGYIRIERIKSTFYSFFVIAKKDSNVQINTAYFPGWMAYVDGNKRKLNIAENGSMILSIPKGEHRIIIKFEDTNVRKLAANLSLISIITLFTLFVKFRFGKIKR